MNILILSYNEGQQIFNKDDCSKIIEKINDNTPSLILLGTQEATFGVNNFSHILSEELKKKNYGSKKINVNSVFKIFAPSILKTSEYRSVRTRIFYKNIEKLSTTEKSFKHSIGKSSICVFVNFTFNNIKHQFIFINAHFAFSGSGDTLLSKRKKQFINTIMEFELYNYVNTHEIFFLGDLNFRLSKDFFKKRDNSTNLKIYIHLNNIIKKLNNDALKYDELYKYIKNNLINDDSDNNKSNKLFLLYTNFLKSMEQIGIEITCRYQNKHNKGLQKIDVSKNLKNNLCNDILDCKKKNTERIPSMCDKILYSLSNNDLYIIKDFTKFFIPYKSDHTMIGLICHIN